MVSTFFFSVKCRTNQLDSDFYIIMIDINNVNSLPNNNISSHQIYSLRHDDSQYRYKKIRHIPHLHKVKEGNFSFTIQYVLQQTRDCMASPGTTPTNVAIAELQVRGQQNQSL